MRRREYEIQITVNGIKISKAIIDSHYEEKHSCSINDDVILQLVNQLDGQFFEPEDIEVPYRYFVTDGMILDGKKYKLIWLIEDGEFYIGVVNAYRRK